MIRSSSQPNADSSTTSYTVLYYKNKKKVHKSKGVTKVDGTLTVVPPPKSLVTLKSSENEIVFSSIQTGIANRVWQEDEQLDVGGYQVEILSIDSLSPHVASTTSSKSKESHNDATKHSQRKSTTLVRSNFLQKRKTNFTRKPLVPLHPRRIAISEKTNGRFTTSISDRQTSSMPNKELKSDSLRSCGSKRPSSGTIVLRSKTKQSRAHVATTQRTHTALSTQLQKDEIRHASQSRSTSGVVGCSRLAHSETSIEDTTGSRLSLHTEINIPHSISSVLKPHQKTGIHFLWQCLTGKGRTWGILPHYACQQESRYSAHGHQAIRNGCILADEMGLGKTLMTIATICALHRQSRNRKFIVVCPSSLVSNWTKEFDKWLGKAGQPRRVAIKKGGEEGIQKIKVFCQSTRHQSSQVLILSYDFFRRNIALIESLQAVRLLVVDEGHRLKNSSGSLTLSALEKLPCEARLLLTATPIQNILSEFYTIANFCCPGIFGDLATFRREYERPISISNAKNCTSTQRELGRTQAKTLEKITKSFMLRRLQKDILKTMLPPRHEIMIFCRTTKDQAILYKELTARYRNDSNFASSASCVTADALTTLMRLRKLCLHPKLPAEDSHVNATGQSQCPFDVDLSGKLCFLNQLILQIHEHAPEDKIVIISNFTSALTVIENAILKRHELSYIRLDGKTELSNRQSLVDTFNRTSACRNFAFLLSSKAGGCGLNLVGANRLVMVDPDWNPASDVQAMARIYRQGQTKACYIYRLFTSGTVEEVICQRQIQKTRLASTTVDGFSTASSGEGFSKSELRDCFTLKENCVCDTMSKMGRFWPPYDGPTGLPAQGCDDPSLLQAIKQPKTPVAYVHVVNATQEKNEDTSCHPKKNYESQSSDEEFGLENFDEKVPHTGNQSDSDEELEFEG